MLNQDIGISQMIKLNLLNVSIVKKLYIHLICIQDCVKKYLKKELRNFKYGYIE